MVEPLGLIFRLFTLKISGIPKFRNFTVVQNRVIKGQVDNENCLS